MLLQDIIIAIVAYAFSYALIPQVIKGFKEKQGVMTLQTAIITTIGLYVLVIVWVSLELWISVVANIFSATCWLILLLQTLLYGKIEKVEAKHHDTGL